MVDCIFNRLDRFFLRDFFLLLFFIILFILSIDVGEIGGGGGYRFFNSTYCIFLFVEN